MFTWKNHFSFFQRAPKSPYFNFVVPSWKRSSQPTLRLPLHSWPWLSTIRWEINLEYQWLYQERKPSPPYHCPLQIEMHLLTCGERQKVESASIPSLSLVLSLVFSTPAPPSAPTLLPLCRATSLLLSAVLTSVFAVLSDFSRSMALHPTYSDNKVHTSFLLVSKLNSPSPLSVHNFLL